MPDIDIDELPGLEEADEQLQRMMDAEEAAAPKARGASATTKTAQRAERDDEGAGKETTETQTETDPDNETDTLATSEEVEGDQAKAKADAEAKAKKEAEGKTVEAGKKESRFAKEQNRRVASWKEINDQKEAIKSERARLETDRQTLDRERQQAEQRFTPEQYADFAAKQGRQAQLLEAQAQKLEDAGKFDEAEATRDKAREAIAFKKAAEKSAAELKANPPADRRAAERKEWMLKAGTDFPDLMKDGSPLKARVTQLFTEEPELKSNPKGIYLAARLAALETEAASVTGLKGQVAIKDKELTALKAKVQELEGLTSPGGPGSANTTPAGSRTFEQMSEGEQLAELSRAAEELGNIR